MLHIYISFFELEELKQSYKFEVKIDNIVDSIISMLLGKQNINWTFLKIVF